MAHWNVSSASIRYLMENTKSSKARMAEKMAENVLQEEINVNSNHAAKRVEEAFREETEKESQASEEEIENPISEVVTGNREKRSKNNSIRAKFS